MTPKVELGRGFCIMHLPPKFHHPMFTRSKVIMLTNTQTSPHTNKQMPLKTSNVLRYATTLGKYLTTVCTLWCFFFWWSAVWQVSVIPPLFVALCILLSLCCPFYFQILHWWYNVNICSHWCSHYEARKGNCLLLFLRTLDWMRCIGDWWKREILSVD